MWGSGLVGGMAIALRRLLRGPIGAWYPDERLVPSERARWTISPSYDDTGSPRCTACMACVHECPDGLLSLEYEVTAGMVRHILHFDYEVGACMTCGLCVEVCPSSALEMSDDHELATTDRESLTVSLLTDIDAAPSAGVHAEAGGSTTASAVGGSAAPMEGAGDV